MRARLYVAALWVVLSIVNLAIYKHSHLLGSALLSALAAGIAVAMLVGVLRDSL